MVVDLLARVARSAPEEPFRLLDIGTADGIMLEPLQAAAFLRGVVWRVWRPSGDLAATCARANGWTVTVGRAEALPFEDGVFDVVTVIVHAQARAGRRTLRCSECHRVLRSRRSSRRRGPHAVWRTAGAPPRPLRPALPPERVVAA